MKQPSAGEIKEARRRLNETQAEFAGRFNVTRHTVQSWELGRRKLSGAAVILFRAAQMEAASAVEEKV